MIIYLMYYPNLKIDNHYNYVSKKYKIDKDVIHSWHCGIHGGLLTDTINENDPDYWSNTVFGNPKYLHFHTCGNYAPGEICLMVENQTIAVSYTHLTLPTKRIV